MNNGADEWNTSPGTRCDTGPTAEGEDAYWDTDRDSTQILKLRMLSILKRFLK
ncbi:MAG: hypothetical protein Ct9H90mP22_8070 [Gammaproteobacteria bacterium]|nr:MAG: hypothetical protein Ct9H90mP22_8070 [Gammaproteobacteria bacterium]